MIFLHAYIKQLCLFLLSISTNTSCFCGRCPLLNSFWPWFWILAIAINRQIQSRAAPVIIIQPQNLFCSVLPAVQPQFQECQIIESTYSLQHFQSPHFHTGYPEIAAFYNTRPTTKTKKNQKLFCPITGLPAKYIDPLTSTPYATPQAFKILRNRYVSEGEQKCEKRLLQLSSWLEEKKRKKLEARTWLFVLVLMHPTQKSFSWHSGTKLVSILHSVMWSVF